MLPIRNMKITVTKQAEFHGMCHDAACDLSIFEFPTVACICAVLHPAISHFP